MPEAGAPSKQRSIRHSLVLLRRCLDERIPGAVRTEVECTCGAPYHARLVPFRVQGQLAVAVIPEGAALTADELRAALRCEAVEKLPSEEMESLFAALQVRGAVAFEDPDFPTIFFDESLLDWPEVVFCPRMFLGKPGDCFRVSTRAFLDLSLAIVAPLTHASFHSHDEWGV